MNVPKCANPDHPVDAKRDSMIIVQESKKEIVFACTLCRDVKKILSAQVITLGHGWNAERELRGIPRAKVVQKTPTGKVRFFR